MIARLLAWLGFEYYNGYKRGYQNGWNDAKHDNLELTQAISFAEYMVEHHTTTTPRE